MRIHVPIAAAALLLAACHAATDPCTPGLRLTPAPDGKGRVSVAANRLSELRARVESCADDDAPSYGFTWSYDRDGDGAIAAAEAAVPAATTALFRLVSCAADAGDHAARVVATPLDERGGAPHYTLEFVVAVSPATAAPRPACVAGAIETVRQTGDVSSHVGLEPLRDALSCLEPYLQNNLCDFEAGIASGLAQFGLVGASLADRYSRRAELSRQDVVDLVEREVAPLVDRYTVIADRAPDDFAFTVEGKFQLLLFEDLPYLNGDENLSFVLQGEHDMGDFRAVRALAEAGQAALEVLLSYHGIVEYMLASPNLDQIDFAWARRSVIEWLRDDATFLTLRREETPDGPTRLQRAQGLLIDAIAHIREALAFVAFERDDQIDDLLRYWDCGSDGLCDCGPTATAVFLACPNDAVEDWTAPDEDGSEGNGRYDIGEPVGIDRFSLARFFAADLPSDIETFRRQIAFVADNLRGPDALDLDEASGIPVSAGLELLAIPVPEIRLSQWFDSPSDPRALFPLYSLTDVDFLVAREGEFWRDVGFDGVATKDERVVHWPNPRDVTLGTGFDALANPDPLFDDLDPICNPVCNFTDGIDNDADGLRDRDDRVRIDRFGFVVVLPQELGPEGNLMFDYLDLNANLSHDATEPAEPFDDAGVTDWRGNLVGRDDGRYTFADMGHDYPRGEDVGPVGDLNRHDPPNGTADDVRTRLQALAFFADPAAGQDAVAYEGLYDPFYVFLPDPTLSGVLRFPDDIVSIDGTSLSENAKMQRFLNKALETATLIQVGTRTGDGQAVPVLNLSAHRCSNAQVCRDTVAALAAP